MHPSHRPDYIHLIPLSEIIMMALGHSSIHTKGVQQAWNKLITDFGSEVAVLLDTDIERLKVVDEKIVNAISAFRDGKLIIHAGGGGKYGWIELPEKENK